MNQFPSRQTRDHSIHITVISFTLKIYTKFLEIYEKNSHVLPLINGYIFIFTEYLGIKENTLHNRIFKNSFFSSKNQAQPFHSPDPRHPR